MNVMLAHAMFLAPVLISLEHSSVFVMLVFLEMVLLAMVYDFVSITRE